MSIKRKIVSLIVLVLLVITTKSYGVDEGKITGDNVRLRKEPSLQAKLIKLLSINDKVEVLGQEGDWYKITSGGDTGYVFKDYIKVKQQIDQSNVSNTESNSNNTNNNTNTTNTDNNTNTNNINSNINEAIPTETEQNQKINITELPMEVTVAEETKISILPLINSSNIATIKANTKVTVIEYKNGWTYILSEIANGWIREEKLKGNNTVQTSTGQKLNNEQEPTDNNQENEKDKNNIIQNNISNKIQVNTTTNTTSNTSNKNNTNSSNTTTSSKIGYATTSVNVRKSANSESEIIDGLVQNDQVTILGEEGGWYKVKVNGITGYIGKKYISSEKSSTTNRSLSTERDDNTKIISKGEEIVAYAKQFLGYKYILGGTTPSKGFDCSGFTYYVYKNFGYNINRTSTAQSNNGIEINKNELQLGDLVFFSQGSKVIGHVGIYIGENKFIHAANERKGIVITELSNSYYKQNYVTARRIIK